MSEHLSGGGSDQLVVQAQGAVVLLGVGPRLQGGGQRQGQGVPVGELPDACSEVHPQAGHLGARGGGGGRRAAGGGRFGDGPRVPVGQGSVRGRRGQLVSRGLAGSARQRPPLQPAVRPRPARVGRPVRRRRRGQVPQRWGEGEGLVFVLR